MGTYLRLLAVGAEGLEGGQGGGRGVHQLVQLLLLAVDVIVQLRQQALQAVAVEEVRPKGEVPRVPLQVAQGGGAGQRGAQARVQQLRQQLRRRGGRRRRRGRSLGLAGVVVLQEGDVGELLRGAEGKECDGESGEWSEVDGVGCRSSPGREPSAPTSRPSRRPFSRATADSFRRRGERRKSTTESRSPWLAPLRRSSSTMSARS